jgi:hypothetical protein
VSQLRKQSKAAEAGLKEDDILLGLNGYSCQTMSHVTAMGLLENTVQSLDLFILRYSQPSLKGLLRFDELTGHF